MLSRSRKYRKSFENYEQAIQKQLNDDFQINQYIDKNKLQANMEEYLKLFNSLQVTKNEKKKKRQNLSLQYTQMNTQRVEKNIDCSKVQSWGGIKEEITNSYEQMQIKTINQIQVKNNLQKEIVQTKKSLNLLKGDIGHLVSRNESANLLESKISKVKIVADDQLKRVSMAFLKDKDQLKIRADMQRKFNKKIKNVSTYQNSTLYRLKKNYIDTMLKKRKIYDRLAYIEKVSASINETGDKKKLINKINKKSLDIYNAFIRLNDLIERIPEIESKYSNTSEEIHQFLNQISSHIFPQEELSLGLLTKFTYKSRVQQTLVDQIDSKDLEVINGENLMKILDKITKQNMRLVQEIEQKSSEYDCQVKKSQQLVSKLEQCDLQISKIHASYIGEASLKYFLTQQKRQQYSQQLKKYIQLLKAIFALLQYIQKYLNYSGKSLDYHKSRQSDKPKKKQTFQSSETVRGQESQSFLLKSFKETDENFIKVLPQSKINLFQDDSLAFHHQGYVSQLYKIYYILLKEQESETKLDTIETNIFSLIVTDIKKWLNQIKNDILQGSKNLIPHSYRKPQKLQDHQVKPKISVRNRDSAISQLKAQKNFIETDEEQSIQVQKENQFVSQNYNRHQSVHKEDNALRYHSFSTSSHLSAQKNFFKMNGNPSIHRIRDKAGIIPSALNIVNVSKLKNSSSQPIINQKKALRIKFLEDIDKDYYKILKSTLKMEKENTRKNYQFLRTFKRAKYSSRDEILQEKRYECSYSMLFAGNKEMKEKVEARQKKSCFFTNTNDNTFGRVSKLIDFKQSQRSSHFIRSPSQTLNLNEKEAKEMREKIQNINSKVSSRNTDSIKRNLSIQMKDIINLV